MTDAFEDLNDLLVEIGKCNGYLDILGAHQALINIERTHEIKMSDLLKVLLTTNGSMTQALQSIQTSPTDLIKARMLNQVVLGMSNDPVDDQIFESISIPKNSAFIYRKVVLCVNDQNLVLAISLIPLCKLSKDFQEELMYGDKPIGFLLEKYQLEVLRKIAVIDAITTTKKFQTIFPINTGDKIPYRIYDIIYKEDLIMKIMEFFNPVL